MRMFLGITSLASVLGSLCLHEKSVELDRSSEEALRFSFLPSPTIAHGNGYASLRRSLSNNVSIELSDQFPANRHNQWRAQLVSNKRTQMVVGFPCPRQTAA